MSLEKLYEIVAVCSVFGFATALMVVRESPEPRMRKLVFVFITAPLVAAVMPFGFVVMIPFIIKHLWINLTAETRSTP